MAGFCTCRLQSSGEVINLPVRRLKKAKKLRGHPVKEFIEYDGEQYPLPVGWELLAMTWEIPPDAERLSRMRVLVLEWLRR